jgi:8-oxo-dGTP pyrophosphatase MutT (NUDIX family)
MKEMIDNSKNPKPASTVILTRQNDGELQIYLVRRSDRSSFMPGNYVFPGGMVEPADRKMEIWKAHADMDLGGISGRLGGSMTVEETLSYSVAAIRETFEEAGVLLAYRNEQSRADLENVCNRRMTKEMPKGWLRQLVGFEGWILAFSRLARWAHWITPELMPQRYDTRFFIAFMPPEQECVPDKKETTKGIWISPEKGLVGNSKGEIPLSPPTVVTLHELLKYSKVEELEREAETRSWGEPLCPRLVLLSRGALILEPWDPMINQEVQIDPQGLEEAILPVGQPFSRIWNHDGIWRPVGV